MLIRSAILFFLLIQFYHSSGQAVEDSLQLEEVKVYGNYLKVYAVGTKTENIDSASMAIHEADNLAGLLSSNSPLYFKSYGAGMLSSISFRGTSASHTAVLWNGININYISLGQTDFSTIPVLSAENVSIQYGSSSALYGSGAIGGSILLNSAPNWESGFSGGIVQEIGSFGKSYTALRSNYGNGKFEGKTHLLYKVAENNFPYNVKGINGKTKEVRQKNAAIKQYGVLQDINYKIAGNQYITVNFWLNYLDRQVQPSITSSGNKDQQQDQNVRIVANYHLKNSLGHFNPRLAYVYDLIRFNGSPSQTYQYIADIQHEFTINRRMKVSAGSNFKHIEADVSGYGKKISENRTDLFALLKYAPWKKIIISGNIRQSFVTGFSAPISPSLGIEYNFLSTNGSDFYWKASVAKSYRVPTLNDRYWTPGGNPDIRSETGKNYESGVQLVKTAPFSKMDFEVTAYTNHVDDWITWQPNEDGSFWSPFNINKVHARGLELKSNFQQKMGALQLSFGLDYAYTRSTYNNKADKKYGEQLMYVPEHNGAFHINGMFEKWFLRLGYSYTGSRNTTIEKLDPYGLGQITAGKSLHFGKNNFTAFIKINNVLNTEYINYESHAMPGRNYNVSLKYTFKNNKQ